MSLISVVTINLNNKQGLINTLDSIFGQCLPNIELVVVDGGSTDGSVDVIMESQHRISAIILNEDTGIYNAMNLGVRQCSGRYVHILNSGDSYTSPSALSDLDFSGEFSFICCAVKKYSPKNFVWVPKAVTDDCFVDVAHPGLIVKREVYDRSSYSENYRVVSDSLFIYRSVKPELAQIYDKVLVKMEPDGISTKPSMRYELEKQRLFWVEGYRKKNRIFLSIKSLLVFCRAIYKQKFVRN